MTQGTINLQKRIVAVKARRKSNLINEKKSQVHNYKSCMFKHDVSDKFGKKLIQNKNHENSNGKSSSRKTREVQNIVAKKLGLKKETHKTFSFQKNII